MKMKLNSSQHPYMILAPLSEEAEDKMYRYEIYDNNGNISDDFEYMLFDEETEEYVELRLFDLINAKFNIIINIYEEEVLENKNIPEAIELVRRFSCDTDDSRLIEFATDLINLFEIAKEKGTSIGFYF